MITSPPPDRRWRMCLVAAWAIVVLTACGGGGGGGGGGAPTAGPGSSSKVRFTGFSFRSALGETTSPPLEDLGAVPATPGAPLDLVVVFHFDGTPKPPLDSSSLPVFTTPAEVTPEAGASSLLSTIPALGEYLLVTDEEAGLYAVEFRPSVPTAPIQISLSAPPAAVPGLFPASRYTARVSTTPGQQVGNLVGPGGSVQFDTTSNPAAWYPKGVADSAPPAVVYLDGDGVPITTPSDGSGDFFPGVWSPSEPGSTQPTFPPGPGDITLAYDRAVVPTAANLFGEDLDGDGVLDPVFFLSSRVAGPLVAHEIPADALGGVHAAFPALSLVDDRDGTRPALDGGDVFLHGSLDGALPGGDPALSATPSTMALGPDPSLLFAVLPAAGDDLLTVVDHVAGDPSHGALAPAAIATGLAEPVGLTSLADGRLVVYDRATRRIVELLPEVTRARPTPEAPAVGAPGLVSLALGDGTTGFVSDVFGAGLDVLDLAQAPSGRLVALARLDGAPFPSLIRLAPIDLDGNGSFEPDDGTFSGAPSDVLADLPPGVVDVAFVAESELLALDREDDALLRVVLPSGAATTAVPQLSAFGLPYTLGAAPARCFAVGAMHLPVDVSLDANDAAGAVVRLTPRGVLPFDQELVVMQRNTFTSLYGTNEVNADPLAPAVPLGAVERLRVVTAAPQPHVGAFVDDLFLEEFDDPSFEDPSPVGLSPVADWAVTLPQGGTSGGLRASVGADEVLTLGDFRPAAPAGFDPADINYRPTSGSTADNVIDLASLPFRVVLLDTDSQTFPLPDGSTPGVTQATTVTGGHFSFRDVVIPAGVTVVVVGSRPLRITATGDVRIDGVIDLSGTHGVNDDTFNSGFIPVPAGPGGPGGGRGGDGHPTRFDPRGSGAIDQYVTPERGERGQGPVVGPTGSITFGFVGGHGGLSTLGYDPAGNGFPKLDEQANREDHRPPGGGGGSFYARGRRSHSGSGGYSVQSESTWFPFTRCVFNDGKRDALYGNDENIASGIPGASPLQCVWLDGPLTGPQRIVPGAEPGDPPFADDDPTNDFIGPGGELQVLIGGQGGGGGGSRIDSMRQRLWSADNTGGALPSPPAPPYYPSLLFGLYFSPTLYDAKGGAGGGGSGSLQIRSFGDIVIGRTGLIEARGGNGGGSEIVSNSTFSGGGGGGSGGAVVLEAAGSVRLLADPGHLNPGYTDVDGDQGAGINVSGGFGRDARTDPKATANFQGFGYEASRSDGGQGGFGLIQLQSGGSDGTTVEPGAFAFARVRTMEKRGQWNGLTNEQEWHPAWSNPIGGPPSDELRFIDVLHYRRYEFDGPEPSIVRHYVLNGSFPPSFPSADGNNGSGVVNEWPPGSGQLWDDTAMMRSELSQDRWVVRDPVPEKILESYLGWDPVTFLEPFWQEGPPPGELWDEDAVIPLGIDLAEPDGTLLMTEVDGHPVVDPETLIDRLPVIDPQLVPPGTGKTSVGVSRWITYAGAVLRARDAAGRTPPFVEPFHGTFNAGVGPVPAGLAGRVKTAAPVPDPTVPGRYVADAGFAEPGLFGGGATDLPFNDVKVDAPDTGIQLEDVVTDNAAVRVTWQGAYPVRAGSDVPDPGTLTAWTADPTALSGYPLLRFRVRFDLDEAPDSLPFGPASLRPQVDRLRLRTRY